MRLFPVGLLVAVVACGTGELTRSQAARELAARFAGPQAPQMVVRVFRTKCVEKYFEKYPLRFREDVHTAYQDPRARGGWLREAIQRPRHV